MQVAAVVGTLAPIGRHEAGHPAAVRVAQRLALFSTVREEVSTCTDEQATMGFSLHHVTETHLYTDDNTLFPSSSHEM